MSFAIKKVKRNYSITISDAYAFLTGYRKFANNPSEKWELLNSNKLKKTNLKKLEKRLRY